jgi:hypothetical protein
MSKFERYLVNDAETSRYSNFIVTAKFYNYVIFTVIEGNPYPPYQN